jgi:hypothetical protein
MQNAGNSLLISDLWLLLVPDAAEDEARRALGEVGEIFLEKLQRLPLRLSGSIVFVGP